MTNDDKQAIESLTRHIERAKIELDGMLLKHGKDNYRVSMFQGAISACNDVLIRASFGVDDYLVDEFPIDHIEVTA